MTNPVPHVELRVSRPLAIDYAFRERTFEALRRALVELDAFQLDARPRVPLERLSAASLLMRSERFPMRPPETGPTHVMRAHAPQSGLRLEMLFRCAEREDLNPSRDSIVVLRVRGPAGARAALESALPGLATALGATDAVVVSPQTAPVLEPASPPATPAPIAVPSYLATAVRVGINVAPASLDPAESAETCIAPAPEEIARLIAEAEPRRAFQRAASSPVVPRASAAEPSSGETLAEPAPGELAALIASALPFLGETPPMEVDAYAVLEALRSARGELDAAVAGRYPDASPAGRACLHAEMRAHFERNPAARGRFEQRLAHFQNVLATTKPGT
jgi:hypothetical protein